MPCDVDGRLLSRRGFARGRTGRAEAGPFETRDSDRMRRPATARSAGCALAAIGSVEKSTVAGEPIVGGVEERRRHDGRDRGGDAPPPTERAEKKKDRARPDERTRGRRPVIHDHDDAVGLARRVDPPQPAPRLVVVAWGKPEELPAIVPAKEPAEPAADAAVPVVEHEMGRVVQGRLRTHGQGSTRIDLSSVRSRSRTRCRTSISWSCIATYRSNACRIVGSASASARWGAMGRSR